MRTHPPFMTAVGLVLTTLSGLTIAQSVTIAPPSPTPVGPSAVFDSRQFPASRGELERLTLTARGDIDGFILKDGTEVKTAPDLGLQIAQAWKAGDRVIVYGLKAAALPLVRAVSITDENSHLTITDSRTASTQNPPPPLAPPGKPAAPADVISETSGKVRMALHGPQGEVNGVLLDNGTILRFPPDPTGSFVSAIQPHQKIVAEGIAISNASGTVVDVQQIGESRDRLVSVGMPPRPVEDRGPARPRRPTAPQPAAAPGFAPGAGAPQLPAPPAG